MCAEEGEDEGVEVVGRGGEVEPDWVEEGLDVRVELGHSGDGGGVGDECGAEDADGGGGHGYLDGVVDVCGGINGILEVQEQYGGGLPEMTIQPSVAAK